MNLRILVLACGMAVAGGAAALVTSARWPTPAAAVPASTNSPKAAIPRDPDRIFLSQAQVAEAVKSGTVDRPIESLLRINKPLSYGGYVWDEQNVPSGPTWIRVDLHSQLMSVFRAGHEIGTAVIVYGGDNKQTPSGKLHILAKAKVHRSSLYDAEMPYTLRLTGDGVSIHGSAVRWGAASHGCIGVPLAFARHLFDVAHVGDEVEVIPASHRIG